MIRYQFGRLPFERIEGPCVAEEHAFGEAFRTFPWCELQHLRLRNMKELLDRSDERRDKYRRSAETRWRYGTLGTEEATRDALQRGAMPAQFVEMYEKARPLAETELPELTERTPSVRRRRRFREEGAELSIDRLLGGDPRHWERRERGRARHLVTLGIRFGMTEGAKEEHFARRIALGGAIADHLERLGWPVQIEGFYCARIAVPNILAKKSRWPRGAEPRYVGLTVGLREPGEPVDVERLLSLGAPGLTRVFAWRIFANSQYHGRGPNTFGSVAVPDSVLDHLGYHVAVVSFVRSYKGGGTKEINELRGAWMRRDDTTEKR